MVVFYRRAHGVDPTTVSVALAIIIPVGGLSGSLIGGWFADHFGKGRLPVKAWVCVVSSVGGGVFMIPALVVQNYHLSFAMLFGAFIFAEAWSGPALSIAQDLVNPSIKSFATTVFCMSTGVGSLGPVITGALNDAFGVQSQYTPAPDPTISLLIMVPGMYALCAIGYSLTAILITLHENEKNQITSEG